MDMLREIVKTRKLIRDLEVLKQKRREKNIPTSIDILPLISSNLFGLQQTHNNNNKDNNNSSKSSDDSSETDDNKSQQSSRKKKRVDNFIFDIEEKSIEYKVPEHCVPIRADVTTFDWKALASIAQFDVILMDPPWQLACANPTRGVCKQQ